MDNVHAPVNGQMQGWSEDIVWNVERVLVYVSRRVSQHTALNHKILHILCIRRKYINKSEYDLIYILTIKVF